MSAWILLPGRSSGQATVHCRGRKVLPSWVRVSKRRSVPGGVLVRRRPNRQVTLCGRHVCCYGGLIICSCVLRLLCWDLLVSGVFRLQQVRTWISRARIGRGLVRQVRGRQACSLRGFCYLHNLPRGKDQRSRQRLGKRLQHGQRQHHPGHFDRKSQDGSVSARDTGGI